MSAKRSQPLRLGRARRRRTPPSSSCATTSRSLRSWTYAAIRLRRRSYTRKRETISSAGHARAATSVAHSPRRIALCFRFLSHPPARRRSDRAPGRHRRVRRVDRPAHDSVLGPGRRTGRWRSSGHVLGRTRPAPPRRSRRRRALSGARGRCAGGRRRRGRRDRPGLPGEMGRGSPRELPRRLSGSRPGGRRRARPRRATGGCSPSGLACTRTWAPTCTRRRPSRRIPPRC